MIEDERHIPFECTECGSERFYALSDGRLQCRDCRRKMSRNPRGLGLAEDVREKVAELFWHMVPADQGAELLGRNRKTVQGYYTRLRREVARMNVAEWRHFRSRDGELGSRQEGLPEGGSDQVVFMLTAHGSRIHVGFPGTGGEVPDLWREVGERPSSAVFAPDRTACEQLELDRFRHGVRPLRQDPEVNGEAVLVGARFWSFARGRLQQYRGGFKKNFPLFMAEMEFRFNYRETADGMNRLLRIMESFA